jgi:small subunit ribosomal protein S21
MREIAEHPCSGDYLLHQNCTPNEWFERGGHLSLKFLLSSGDDLWRRIGLGRASSSPPVGMSVPFFSDQSVRALSSIEPGTKGVSSKQVHLDGVGGVTRMAEVRLQEGESLENALRRFKRKVMTEDIIKDVKRHSFYLKPGERRRVKQALAQKRARKKIRKDGDQVAPKRGAVAK